MQRLAVAVLLVGAFLETPDAQAARTFTEGHDYVRLPQPQSTTVPAGKIEVMEVFSYGCPACNIFEPKMNALRRALPANAQLVLLPAAFNTAEDWPMFQRAYFTAQFLHVAEQAHQGIFDAVWKSGELATIDPGTNRLKERMPSIEDAARVYARLTGVKPETFLATARSFSVDVKMKAANSQILAMQVPGTPSIIVNGRYRVDSMGSAEELIELVQFLVAKESAPH
ncbi:MAG: thiol:disulfide interchange protein DsbA/DsbL [Steroidobacteraceae bacterium]